MYVDVAKVLIISERTKKVQDFYTCTYVIMCYAIGRVISTRNPRALIIR